MPQIPNLVDMLKSGVHFGHKKSKRHPKMESFIYMTKGEVSVIDLAKTQEYLATALEYVSRLISRGGIMMFVGTKKQAQDLVKRHAESCGMPYVHSRWLGGTLTNFAVIGKLIKKFKKLKEQRDAGEFSKYTKKEQLDITREIEELDALIGGIQNLLKIPDAVFIQDLKKEKTALHEARKRGIPIIAVCDTNANPEEVDYPIPANDDAIKSIDLLLGLVAAAVNEGKAQKPAEQSAPVQVPVTPSEAPAEEKKEA